MAILYGDDRINFVTYKNGPYEKCEWSVHSVPGLVDMVIDIVMNMVKDMVMDMMMAMVMDIVMDMVMDIMMDMVMDIVSDGHGDGHGVPNMVWGWSTRQMRMYPTRGGGGGIAKHHFVTRVQYIKRKEANIFNYIIMSMQGSSLKITFSK